MNSESLHHTGAALASEKILPPRPSKARPGWLNGLRRFFLDDTEERWGGRLIRISNDMMLVCDEDLRILYHNRAFLKGVGYQAGTFVGQSLVDFLPAADRSDVWNTFQFVLTEKSKAARLEADMVTQRGQRIFDWRIVRSLHSSGKYFFYLVGRDETERRLAERRLHESNESRFFHDLSVAAWRTDRELRIVDSCGALWNSLDIPGESLLGLDLSDLRCSLTPRFFHQIDCSDALAGQFFHTDIEWNGGIFDVTVEPVRDARNDVVGTVGMMRFSRQATRSLDQIRVTPATGVSQATRKVRIGPALTSRLSGRMNVNEFDRDPLALAN